MMHVVTAANRSIYTHQIDEMHRMRWRYYVEVRGWRELREMQEQPGLERDEYDDELAVYLLGLDDEGHVTGSVRLRPTHDKSLLADKHMHFLDDPASFTPSPTTWEVCRIIRKPEERKKNDHALRFMTNSAMIEFALSRGVKKLIAGGDSFFLPNSRRTWRHKFHLLGFPQPYEEGEFIVGMVDVDEETLRLVREAAGFVSAQMFEIPAPVPGRRYDPVIEERAARLLSTQPLEKLVEVSASLVSGSADRTEEAEA